MPKQLPVVPAGSKRYGPPCCDPLSEAAIQEDDAAQLAQAFKALGDPVRLRLLSMIASNSGGEVCVCELTPAFDLTGPTISHHLKVLREAGLIDHERRGTWVYYWVRPEQLAALSRLLDVPAAAGSGSRPPPPGLSR